MEPSEIVERFYTPLFRFAWALIGDRDEASHLAREVFVEWFSTSRATLSSDEAKVSLFAALFRRFRSGTNQPPTARRSSIPVDALAFEAVERLEADALLVSLGGLEITQRGVLMLFYGAGCSAHEIGTILNLSPTSVTWALTRGKAEWRELLARSGSESDPASGESKEEPHP